jgi:hypothetical protein
MFTWEGEALRQVNYQNKSDSFVGYKIILYVMQASKFLRKDNYSNYSNETHIWSRIHDDQPYL